MESWTSSGWKWSLENILSKPPLWRRVTYSSSLRAICVSSISTDGDSKPPWPTWSCSSEREQKTCPKASLLSSIKRIPGHTEDSTATAPHPHPTPATMAKHMLWCQGATWPWGRVALWQGCKGVDTASFNVSLSFLTWSSWSLLQDELYTQGVSRAQLPNYTRAGCYWHSRRWLQPTSSHPR